LSLPLSATKINEENIHGDNTFIVKILVMTNFNLRDAGALVRRCPKQRKKEETEAAMLSFRRSHKAGKSK